MSRVKRGTQSKKRKKNLLKHAKGFQYGRKSKYKLAKDALRHAWTYAYRDRKVKKRTFRNLWNLQINSLARQNGVSYSRFINGLKNKKIELDRKILAELANEHPKIFKYIIDEVKSK
ncbi:MAG: 50S ribosomal protein L20 [Candidatus Staskawiczbacteria bacterium RIFCSPLOWO2_12_FULL_37_15]|uniref:Large ribosomal subunit protein bL20 n=1 Tax=Candidatus Staskawiczbacteria bacterium RIFCSPLOWO2_12_FULL_37_15 TaxID=1802218 RepID=A0A1G2ITR4_9BACT|nr:MAG: 50S ribosomal protein L20 [Parcubacteria group bacterium GW2011_GWA2_37_10]OGZ77518.1 MAG: 50S ribosomal protein L20 [Candidatus Staskawiczbacteria bacterium RIFCSPLOWO2_12_FULL_37_15]